MEVIRLWSRWHQVKPVQFDMMDEALSIVTRTTNPRTPNIKRE